MPPGRHAANGDAGRASSEATADPARNRVPSRGSSELPFDAHNLAYLEELWAELGADEPVRDPSNRAWLGTLGLAPVLPRTIEWRSRRPPPLGAGEGAGAACVPVGAERQVTDAAIRQERLAQLVRAHRELGHLVAHVDPLGRLRRSPRELEPEHWGLSASSREQQFSARTLEGPDVLTLEQILERLRNTYCRSIGVQYMHMSDPVAREWLRARMEATENRLILEPGEQRHILTKLTEAVIFEEFLQTKYLGAKSFSLEGTESLVPLLTSALDYAAERGLQAVVLAMAHRGRLNVLANVMGKRPREIFREFEDRQPHRFLGRGDVKYHLGYESEYLSPTGRRLRLSLCFNPSHLEFVDPVALGRVRARQDQSPGTATAEHMAILIHGDAAVAGQGVVAETLNLAGLSAFGTGGTLHVVVNNQIGFTTLAEQGRSSTYATDLAQGFGIPVFHVNGEDPEAVAQVVRLAIDYRSEFRRDVLVDMYGYRRHGHNEGDEPTFTQPLLYELIGRRKGVRDGYLDHLLDQDGVTRDEAERIALECRANLERELSMARGDDAAQLSPEAPSSVSRWTGGRETDEPELSTGVESKRLTELLQALTRVPPGFTPHRKLERWIQQRSDMLQGFRPVDWGTAEALALASLARDGVPIRLTGQDSERGTFSHRHAVWHDALTGATHQPLCHLAADQAQVHIANSPLSEVAVLGFEYGYSLDNPTALVLWEAQFGDFVNVAQVIIDQFLVSAEVKWNQLSGVTLLLPHGWEGMGPEHTSARLERWLALAAEDNIQICQPTTPAQLFHLLRRQALRSWKKPLVILTPKSLLRHPKVTSPLEELRNGRFQRILGDLARASPAVAAARKILLCSGKLFYALEQRREELGRWDVALLRVEQLYPLRDAAFAEALEPYPAGTPIQWVQDEPANMGALVHLRARFGGQLLSRFPLSFISRPESASPATGSSSSHRLEQEQLLARALEG